MGIKKSILYIGLVLLVLVVGGLFFFREGSSVNGNVISEGAQIVPGDFVAKNMLVITKKKLKNISRNQKEEAVVDKDGY